MVQTRRARGGLRRAAVGGVVTLGLLPVGAGSARAVSPPPARPIDSLCADVPAEFQPFDDVRSDTFRQAIRCQAAAGITRGVAPFTYAPGGPVTRAQMATFVANMMDAAVELQDSGGLPLHALPASDGSKEFTDVGADDVHRQSISRLAAAGITQGGSGDLPDSSYGPGLTVSREQMASFIVRALDHLRGSSRSTSTDYFTDDATSIHQANINVVASEGIAIGVGGGRFEPGATLNREQMSAFIMRSLASLKTDGRITPIPGGEPVDYVPCQNADGFTISYPETWFSDESCRYFHPQPFEVLRGTDANFAAVKAELEPKTPSPPVDDDTVYERLLERTTVTIDGRSAVRLETESTGAGLWSEGVRRLSYSVDLGDSSFSLVTLGTSWMDYRNNKTVLDRMAQTVDIVD